MVEQCELEVSQSGKFEGCPRFAPYFWSLYLDGSHDDDDGHFIYFDVNGDDVSNFPELSKCHRVTLCEDDHGFITCVAE